LETLIPEFNTLEVPDGSVAYVCKIRTNKSTAGVDEVLPLTSWYYWQKFERPLPNTKSLNLQPRPQVTSWNHWGNQKPNDLNDLEDDLDSLQWESEKFKMTPDLLQWKVQSDSERDSEFESERDLNSESDVSSDAYSDYSSENHDPLLELYSE